MTRLNNRALNKEEYEMDEQVSREIITYEYRVEDTPKYTMVDETWELYDVFPAKWHPGNKVLVFRKAMDKPISDLVGGSMKMAQINEPDTVLKGV